MAPALHREYVLKNIDGTYEQNEEGIMNALFKYQKASHPVRFVGFPGFLFFLLRRLKEEKIKFCFHSSSRIILGGGWKQFSDERIDKAEFYALIKEYLGIPAQNIKEFFSAVEHPIAYCSCENGHFHVPIYSRVIVRDVKTLQPLPYGEEGLLSFITPLLGSVPYTSVMTDDIAVLRKGENCGCGISSPYFEVLRRASDKIIRTCAADAAAVLGGKK